MRFEAIPRGDLSRSRGRRVSWPRPAPCRNRRVVMAERADPPGRSGRSPFFWLALVIAGVYLMSSFPGLRSGGEAVAYSQFLSWVDQGKVAEVTLGTKHLAGELKE